MSPEETRAEPESALLKAVASKSKWPILKCILKKGQLSLSEVAGELNMHISNVSRDVDELEKIRPEIVVIELEPKDKGGRPYKMISLTSVGREIVGTVIRATEEQKALRNTPQEDIQFLANVISEPRGSEAVTAAWTEVYMLARETRLWETEQIWQILRTSIVEKPNERSAVEKWNENLHYALVALQVMLSNAKRVLVSGEKYSGVLDKANQTYLRIFEEMLGDGAVPSGRRLEILDILDYLESEKMKFNTCFKAWKRATSEIEDDQEFTSFLQPMMGYMLSTKLEVKRSVRKELYAMMDEKQQPEQRIRARASQMARNLLH